ncbi:FixH family protein [Deefgea sp. CFH1-16]|uniref:FixH family protein n=1 Tax=Deefgea sp. CFH1-16 TaxID=2675457 RepID=UPI0015F60F57|nr:FixH family protein [Deefgea sp. CFH1-16]MBM5575751.1 hypothetical protein [Deefgea sp. CFH1-16]
MTEEQKPWYKHPHVWLLITFPVLAIMGGFHMLYLVSTSTDSLVSDNYYKEGNQVNQRLEQDQAAVAKGITAQILLGDNQRTVRIILNRNDLGPIKLKVIHPTLSGQDQEAPLSSNDGIIYNGEFAHPVTANRWYAELSDMKNTWSLRKEWASQISAALTLP